MKSYPIEQVRRFPLIPRYLAAALALTGAIESGGCGQAPPVDRPVTRGLDATDRYLTLRRGEGGAGPDAAPAARPAATLEGRVITYEDLRPALFEASGALVLEEQVLGAMLEREARDRGVMIAQADIEREELRLLEALGATDNPAGPDPRRLLEQTRSARGLGENRYAALLRRNALLRALVADDVELNSAAIDLAYQLRYGPRSRVRLIVAPGAAAASAAIERIRGGEPFGEVAAEVSNDPSAPRGGIIEPISGADPSYPTAVRDALRTMKPGDLSVPIAIEQGFAILQLEEVIEPASPPPSMDEVRPQLEREARLAQERLLMNRLVSRLLNDAPLVIIDSALQRAWNERTRRDTRP